MTKHMSYSAQEKEYQHILRDRLNRSEDPVDLENFFSSTVTEMINMIDRNTARLIYPDDIVFSPSVSPHFTLSPRIRKNGDFMRLWRNSDLKSIVGRFADCAYHHYRHLAGHPEKTRKKIRSVVRG